MTWFKELQRTSGVNWYWPVILDWMLSNARGGGGGAQTRKNLRWLAGDKSEIVVVCKYSLPLTSCAAWAYMVSSHLPPHAGRK